MVMGRHGQTRQPADSETQTGGPAQRRPPDAATGRGGHDHVVEFYETDAGLAVTVGDFLGPALRGGETTIVVATAEHRAAFAAVILAAGIDLEAAIADGRYVTLDAGALLETLMVSGVPDPIRFHDEVGPLIDRAASGGRGVRVYGEMVALLWDDGDVSSTIGLEDLWNDLATSRDFALLCAYPANAFDAGTTAALKAVCERHHRVVGAPAVDDRADWTTADAPLELRSGQLGGAGGQLAGAGGAGFEIPLMAKALGGLYLAGGTLALVTLLLPHTVTPNALGLLIIVANAYLVSAGLVTRARSLPGWLLRVALMWGTTLITGVAYFSGQRPSPLIFFYLWIFLYSSYFFTKWQTAAQIAYVGLAYGVLLIVAPPPAAGAWWVVTMGTLLVTAVLIWTMRERGELLIARLYDAARTDPLTKLFNRRGFRELLDLELERGRRGDHQVVLLAGDLDHFKAVNDRSGHQVGDAVLQRIARVLASSRRQIDTIARVGGEEFALILPDTDEAGGLVVAERLRRAVLDEFADDGVPITISFGLATFPGHGETAASLVHAADEALYRAKETGRNRSVAFSPDAPNQARYGARNRDVEGERFTAVMLDLASAVDLRFSGSARHSETVGRYAEMMARELGLSEQRVGRVRLGGLLHDIGKVGVADAVLNKPGRLSPDELATIRTHPALGAQILEHPCLADIRPWVAAHHERPDGHGYPCGLSGRALGVEARILAVADAYEAMTSNRAYRPSIGQAAARAELRRCAGSQFDPEVVDALLAVLDRDAERVALQVV
jgi:diguanylate cyclase (GGDEF)-like protein/putative nucleotidyltransferase with HDIG domain